MISDDLRQRLQAHGQEHLLAALEKLGDREQMQLLREIERIDLAELKMLHAKRDHKDALPERARVEPLPPPPATEQDADLKEETGRAAFEDGQVAYVLVAGGQGTRLGFDHPKGMYPIGPLSGKSLFQLHAEKIQAQRRRYGGIRIPFLVMTSPATDAETRLYFKRKNYFHLPPQDVHFFCQGTMPAVDLASGRILMESLTGLALSPNGHGGTITGLLDSGLIDRLEALDIRTIYYFQVDNPLVNLDDVLFLGKHLEAKAQVSSKVLPKTQPLERVGNFLLVDGRCSMIEYSDLPEDWARETDGEGNLTFWAANPAIHLFDLEFLRQIATEAERLPWHLARKIVPHLDASGQQMKPDKENALKFERFIFDVLPQAERWTIHAIEREDEFAPVKNKEGVDSPATSQQAMCDQAARLLNEVGVTVPPGVKVEISPLFALDRFDIEYYNRQIPPIVKNTYLREPKR